MNCKINQAKPEDQDLPRHHKQRVLTQVWIALCVNLVLAYLKFKAKLAIFTQPILTPLQINLFST